MELGQKISQLWNNWVVVSICEEYGGGNWKSQAYNVDGKGCLKIGISPEMFNTVKIDQ